MTAVVYFFRSGLSPCRSKRNWYANLRFALAFQFFEVQGFTTTTLRALFFGLLGVSGFFQQLTDEIRRVDSYRVFFISFQAMFRAVIVRI